MCRIHVKNVLFGDCNILESENTVLVVDCGSANKRKPRIYSNVASKETFTYSKIQFLENDIRTKDLLISHYHEDHFNGILQVKLRNKIKFQHIYLPFTILEADALEKYESAIGWLALLFCIALPGTATFRITDKLLKLWKDLPDIVVYFNNIRCLNRSHVLISGNLRNEVLWPAIKVEQWLKSLGDSERARECIRWKLKNDFGRCMDVFDIGKEKYLFIYNLLCVITGVLNKRKRNSEDLNTYSENLHALNEIAVELRAENKKNYVIADDAKKRTMLVTARAAYHDYSDLTNAASVIFHESDDKSIGRYIFLGDATADVIKAIRQESCLSFKKYYQAVKVQHHGTQSHFTRVMPAGQNYIISNGGYKRRKISEKLLRHIVADATAEIYCTGAHEGRPANNSGSVYCESTSGCPFCVHEIVDDAVIKLR